jgi:hypothetical protein
MTEIKDKLCSFTDEFSALPLNIYSYSGRTDGRAGWHGSLRPKAAAAALMRCCWPCATYCRADTLLLWA